MNNEQTRSVENAIRSFTYNTIMILSILTDGSGQTVWNQTRLLLESCLICQGLQCLPVCLCPLELYCIHVKTT